MSDQPLVSGSKQVTLIKVMMIWGAEIFGMGTAYITSIVWGASQLLETTMIKHGGVNWLDQISIKMWWSALV